MKNMSFVVISVVSALVSACSSTQENASTGTTPTPTVTVPPVQSAEPVVEKPTEDKPAGTETQPPSDPPQTGGGRLALQQCSEESRKTKGCTKERVPVCAEVDTGIRCIRAPCPSTMQQTYDNACTACANKNVRGYWGIACEEMTKPADTTKPAVQ